MARNVWVEQVELQPAAQSRDCLLHVVRHRQRHHPRRPRGVQKCLQIMGGDFIEALHVVAPLDLAAQRWVIIHADAHIVVVLVIQCNVGGVQDAEPVEASRFEPELAVEFLPQLDFEVLLPRRGT